MVRMGHVSDLTEGDLTAVLKLALSLSFIDRCRKIHSMSDIDTEFDFDNLFWRYELSLARLHGLQPAPHAVTLPESLEECVVPSRLQEAAETSFGASNHHSAVGPTCDRRSSATNEEASLARLQTLFSGARSRAISPVIPDLDFDQAEFMNDDPPSGIDFDKPLFEEDHISAMWNMWDSGGWG